MNRDIFDVLETSPVFGGLTPDEIRQYFTRLQVLNFAKNRTIFSQGQPAIAFYIIVEGWLRLVRPGAGGEVVTIHVFGPGETFAEALLAPGAIYPASAETLTSVKVVRVDTEGYRTLIATQPRAALAIVMSNFRKLKGLVDQVEQIKGWTLKRRVAEAILRFCPLQSGRCVFDFPFERGIVAQKLGISAATLSRAFPSLASLGVHVTRDEILVEDVARLAAYVRDGRLLPGG
jgi:CRP-like cAMP-binding protein